MTARPLRVQPLVITLYLIVLGGQLARAVPPKLTWKQCHDLGGDTTGIGRPVTCPEGQHEIGQVTDARCPCICCAPAGAATESRINFGLPIVEVRGGRKSVWGIKLYLETPLQDPIKRDHISIVESKHSRELRKLMDFKLKNGGRELEIVFKAGKGDFGSGNSVHVTISSGTALANGKLSTKESSNDISTDLP